jgi:hypothetical protein
MSRSLEKDQPEESSEERNKAPGEAGAPSQQPASTPEIEALHRVWERRERLLAQDDLGRTPLFYVAEQGLEKEVWSILSSFRGTGLFPPRLALITITDHAGLTAADVAEQAGHERVADLLRKEEIRMEYYE